METLMKYLKQLSESLVDEPLAQVKVVDVVDALLDIRSEIWETGFPMDGDQLALMRGRSKQ
ncbi:MAG: hypothetical protein VKL42_19425 [Snowella sp.]|nr:hypothetical protein [Snowella sp.]